MSAGLDGPGDAKLAASTEEVSHMTDQPIPFLLETVRLLVKAVWSAADALAVARGRGNGDASAEWQAFDDALNALESSASAFASRALAAEEERDYFQSRLVDFSRVAQADFTRAEAAEQQRDVLKKAMDEILPIIAELERALRACEEVLAEARFDRDEWITRCKNAEARITELEGALREIAALNGGYPDDYCAIARRALGEEA